MIMLILPLLLLCGRGSLLSSAFERKIQYLPENYENYFNTFIKEYNRQYADEAEKLKRFEIFKQSLQTINKQNLENEHAVFGINNVTDWTMEEFLALRTGLILSEEPSGCTIINGSNLPYSGAPESFDWRTLGKVTRAKDQGQCNSCWAFSTIGNLEGQYAIKTNQLVEFSEQQLVSCDKVDGGCNGGNMVSACRSLQQVGGAMTEADYPYEDQDLSCKFDKNKVITRVTDCTQYDGLTEDQLVEVLHKIGPISIGVDSEALKHYHQGILMTCPVYQVNHAVLLVGYGTENGTSYWTIKNSWGPSFGENGYMRVKRGINACGLLNGPITSAVL